MSSNLIPSAISAIIVIKINSARFGLTGFESRREQAGRRGRLRGIGFANIIEHTSQAQGETVMVRLDPRGVQGIGQAITKQLVYDNRSGQLLSGSLMDYGLPRADEVCAFEMAENPVPTRTNPLGVKGAGEVGNVGALAAIMNAVVDALSPLGIAHIDMPATPEKVWRDPRRATSLRGEPQPIPRPLHFPSQFQGYT